MKEIIEVDTDTMKEVLCLRATFVPTPAQQMAQGNICSHSNTKNYSVKFGLRRETVKEIIEVYTDTMKEVLRLRATFAPTPTPTQQIMLSNLGQ